MIGIEWMQMKNAFWISDKDVQKAACLEEIDND